MKPVGKGKLSKRDGEKGGFPVFPLSWKESEGYREAGYFPEAVVNFLALLGWNPGTEQELFSLNELIDSFSLDRVHKSGARFDPEKTKWYNHQYLQTKDNSELTSLFAQDLSTHLGQGASDINQNHLQTVVSLIKERANFVKDFWDLGHYFFQAPSTYNEKAVKKQWKEDTPRLMKEVIKILTELKTFDSATIESAIKDWITSNDLGFGKVMGPLRLIIVGDMKGPHLSDILELLGKNEAIHRIQQALENLS